MLATNGQHSEPLIVRFETGDHWDIGRESVATVRVNGIVCIADRKAWATAKFAYPKRREAWEVKIGECNPWGSAYKLLLVRRL